MDETLKPCLDGLKIGHHVITAVEDAVDYHCASMNHVSVQKCIQVFKLWGPLDPFLKKLGVHCYVLGVQLIYSQQD